MVEETSIYSGVYLSLFQAVHIVSWREGIEHLLTLPATGGIKKVALYYTFIHIYHYYSTSIYLRGML